MKHYVYAAICRVGFTHFYQCHYSKLVSYGCVQDDFFICCIQATKNRPKDNDDADITATEMKVPRKMVVKTGGSSFVDKTQLFEGEIGNTKEQKVTVLFRY